MPQSLFEHNAKVLQEPNISTCILPPMFIVKRFLNPYQKILQGFSEEDAYTACLLSTEKVPSHPNPIWRFTMIEHPDTILAPFTILETQDRWLRNESHRIIVQRKSTEPIQNNKLYVTVVKYSGISLRISSRQIIPILKLDSPCLVLPTRFLYLVDKHTSFRFICKPLQTTSILPIPRPTAPPPRPPTPPRSIAPPPRSIAPPPRPSRRPPTPDSSTSVASVQFPQHIINGFIENLVTQGKTCCIDQTPLTRSTTSITPCGHAMNSEAIQTWLRMKGVCPVCRAPCTVSSLQTWK